ncbi:transglutaminase-like domain-containing protein [Alkalisalibacterium limincola]|uniref:Transglutaminase domain-containing protein n=1 Tax=Alkalisalibacterium limincola TaxID=2699169 RepID=A0A5C8KXX7_9GAMM|nr:transglutaminase-like domain-containing protein [Alkalisalibacterium limincola]TXK65646.1 transglutaminase domain-containing protein [Alkalisalibacterium limincola]
MAFSTGTLSALNGVLADINMPNPLGETALLDIGEEHLRDTAREVAGEGDQITRARHVHDYVRDQVRFGFGSHFWRLKASEVLQAGRGHALPKATLFTAMLRAVGVPARMHFVSVGSDLLSGLIDLPMPRYDHAVVEVWLGDQWLACDSFVVDPVYFEAARLRLIREGRHWGYGVHVDGRVEWNGRAPSFSQLVIGGPEALPAAVDLGVRADALALYSEEVPEASMLPMIARLRWRFLARSGNQRIAEVLAGD